MKASFALSLPPSFSPSREQHHLKLNNKIAYLLQILIERSRNHGTCQCQERRFRYTHHQHNNRWNVCSFLNNPDHLNVQNPGHTCQPFLYSQGLYFTDIISFSTMSLVAIHSVEGNASCVAMGSPKLQNTGILNSLHEQCKTPQQCQYFQEELSLLAAL